jgi:hypothetical protein
MEVQASHTEHDISASKEKRVHARQENNNGDAVNKEPVKGLP